MKKPGFYVSATGAFVIVHPDDYVEWYVWASDTWVKYHPGIGNSRWFQERLKAKIKLFNLLEDLS